jgi:hypothetical protein
MRFRCSSTSRRLVRTVFVWFSLALGCPVINLLYGALSSDSLAAWRGLGLGLPYPIPNANSEGVSYPSRKVDFEGSSR